MLPPFFFKGVSDQGVIDSYVRVMDALPQTGWRMYLYHIPQVVGVGLSHHTIESLIQRYSKLIVGIKDSSCERDHSVGLAKTFMPGITVYVGNELDLPTLGKMGSTGAISGLANFLPRTVHRLVKLHDGLEINRDISTVSQVLDLLRPMSLMPALKGVMAHLTQNPNWLRVRPPLVGLTQLEFSQLSKTFETMSINESPA
jgi:4-hydroxy-tetrahydrodipicolinate synthase